MGFCLIGEFFGQGKACVGSIRRYRSRAEVPNLWDLVSVDLTWS